MAYQFFTGGSAATNFEDLITKLKTFLTTNSALVAAGQQWTLLADTGGDIFFRAPGLAGTDQIYVNLTRTTNPAIPYYNLGFRGADGYTPGVGHAGQPNRSALVNYLYLWDQPMDCWFFANGRRVIVFAKVNNTFQSAYAGFILPFGTPAEFPYPMYVGATNSSATNNWTAFNNNNRSFFDPSNGQLRHVDGAWLTVQNYINSGTNSQQPMMETNIYPWCGIGSSWGNATADNFRDSPGGIYPLFDAILLSTYSQGNVYGVLDGVFYVPGFNQASENIVTRDGFDHLVFQNLNRNDLNNYCAIRVQ